MGAPSRKCRYQQLKDNYVLLWGAVAQRHGEMDFLPNPARLVVVDPEAQSCQRRMREVGPVSSVVVYIEYTPHCSSSLCKSRARGVYERFRSKGRWRKIIVAGVRFDLRLYLPLLPKAPQGEGLNVGDDARFV